MLGLVWKGVGNVQSRCLRHLHASNMKATLSTQKPSSPLEYLRDLSRQGDALKLREELLKLGSSSLFPERSKSFPRITAKVCVSSKHKDIDLAFNILECLSKNSTPTLPTATLNSSISRPSSSSSSASMTATSTLPYSSRGLMIIGMVELLEACLAHDYINDAISMSHRLNDMNSQINMQTLEKIISKLVLDCRIDTALELLDGKPISDGVLVTLAEPLIMSGRVHEFSQYLEKFLCTPISPLLQLTSPTSSSTFSGKSTTTPSSLALPQEQTSSSSSFSSSTTTAAAATTTISESSKQLVASFKVSRVIKSLFLARTRRFMSSTNNTTFESDAMLKIFKDLETYHKALIGQAASTSTVSELSKFPSYFATKLLYDAEKEVLSSEVDLFETDPCRRSELGFIVPTFEITKFPYVVEDRDFHSRVSSSNKSAQINDLTTEIEKRELNSLSQSNKQINSPRFVLFTKDIFPESYDHQIAKFMRDNEKGNALINLRGLLDVLQTARDDSQRKWNEEDDGAVEVEEEDDDDDEAEGDDVEGEGEDDDDDDDDEEDFDDEEEDEGDGDDEEDDDDEEYGMFENGDDDDDVDDASTMTISSVKGIQMNAVDWENSDATFQILIEGNDADADFDDGCDMEYVMYSLGNGRMNPIMISDDVNKNLVFSGDIFTHGDGGGAFNEPVPVMPESPLKPFDGTPKGGDSGDATSSGGGGETIKIRDDDESSAR